VIQQLDMRTLIIEWQQMQRENKELCSSLEEATKMMDMYSEQQENAIQR
jgi:hypothetical protein